MILRSWVYVAGDPVFPTFVKKASTSRNEGPILELASSRFEDEMMNFYLKTKLAVELDTQACTLEFRKWVSAQEPHVIAGIVKLHVCMNRDFEVPFLRLFRDKCTE